MKSKLKTNTKSLLMVISILFNSTIAAEMDYNDIDCPKNINSKLTSHEYALLMENYIEIQKKQKVSKIMQGIGNYKCLIKKIRGEATKKSTNEIRTLITLIEIINNSSQSSEIYQIEDGLYERFLLQPKDFFETVRWRKHKRGTFCYHLSKSAKSYMVENKIKTEHKDFREYFKEMHSDSLNMLDRENNINHCLSRMYSKMPNLNYAP